MALTETSNFANADITKSCSWKYPGLTIKEMHVVRIYNEHNTVWWEVVGAIGVDNTGELVNVDFTKAFNNIRVTPGKYRDDFAEICKYHAVRFDRNDMLNAQVVAHGEKRSNVRVLRDATEAAA